jgi:hypothetical protein
MGLSVMVDHDQGGGLQCFDGHNDPMLSRGSKAYLFDAGSSSDGSDGSNGELLLHTGDGG